jgi:hypothetical protein
MTPAVCSTTARKEKRSWCCTGKEARGNISVLPAGIAVCKIACEYFRHETSSKKVPTAEQSFRYVTAGDVQTRSEKLVMLALEVYEERDG